LSTEEREPALEREHKNSKQYKFVESDDESPLKKNIKKSQLDSDDENKRNSDLRRGTSSPND
jgi:hypothetical protein